LTGDWSPKQRAACNATGDTGGFPHLNRGLQSSAGDLATSENTEELRVDQRLSNITRTGIKAFKGILA
jgi:hypothetical protein